MSRARTNLHKTPKGGKEVTNFHKTPKGGKEVTNLLTNLRFVLVLVLVSAKVIKAVAFRKSFIVFILYFNPQALLYI